MKFHVFWARGEARVENKGRPWTIRLYGGSDESLDDAQRRAAERAQRAATAIDRGEFRSYDYDGRALREEIVQEVHDSTGLAAVITRNSYGSLILNTSRVMFVDVDAPSPAMAAPTIRGLWNALRGKPLPHTADAGNTILSRIEAVTSARTGLGCRVYRTAGGFRLLITSDTYDPKSETAVKLLSDFGSDPLYMRLCSTQQCFRARLSAKFWRCGVRRPPARFPWANAAEEQRYRKWEEDYHQVANGFATCELVTTFGDPDVCEAVQPIMETHDRLTIHDGARLA